MSARIARLLVVGLPLACSADPLVRDQWRVTIATDAPVPALADRLLVEVVDGRGELACAGCSRLFGVDTSTSWPISLGIVEPPSARALRLRARLFRNDQAGGDGRPRGRPLVDALGALPDSSGVTDVALALSMVCHAVPTDPVAGTTCSGADGSVVPIPTLSRAAGPLPAPRSWPLAQPGECPEPAPDGMTCVPGGVFMLGDARIAATSPTAAIERLTRVDAFAIDTDEMTVSRARALIAKSGVTELPALRGERACVYTRAADAVSDPLPVNCVSFALASKLCEADGKRLPTEAEWEYAAGSTSEERLAPWGQLDVACESAVVGRGRTLQEGGLTADLSTACRFSATESRPYGPVAGGSPLDVTSLGILNMGGNLSEFTLGAPAPHDDPCYGQDRVLVNPRCPLADLERTTRGGHWAMPPLFAATAQRGTSLRGADDSFTGVRCVKPYDRP